MIGSLTLILLSWLVAVAGAAAPQVVIEPAPEGGQKLTHLSEHLALARGPAVIALEAAGGEVVGLTTHDLVRLCVESPVAALDLALGAVAAALASGGTPVNLESWAEERGRALTEALADRYSEPALRGLGGNDELAARFFPGGVLAEAEVRRAAKGGDRDLAWLLAPSRARARLSRRLAARLVGGEPSCRAAPGLGAASP